MSQVLTVTFDTTDRDACANQVQHALTELAATAPGFDRGDVLAAEGQIVVHLWWQTAADADQFVGDGWAAFSTATGGTGQLSQTAHTVLALGKSAQELANEALVRRANEAFSRKDLEALLDCYADDAVQYEPFIDEPIAGKAKLREYFEGSFRYFPDEIIDIQQLISDGPYVIGKWRCRGTHSGDFLGMPATGRTFDVPEATIYEIREGKVQNLWVYVDSGLIAKQFGFGVVDAARGR